MLFMSDSEMLNVIFFFYKTENKAKLFYPQKCVFFYNTKLARQKRKSQNRINYPQKH